MKPFRFGVVGTPQGGATAWRELAQRAESLGYSSLLMPDGMQLLSPFPALALAAGATSLRVGTYVLAAPLRPPATAAWDGHSLAVLTDGRFEFGIGTGRPEVAESARRLGLPYGDAAARLAQVGAAIDQLRELDGPGRHTPVLVAAGGPKARALAAAKADIVTIAAGPLVGRDEIGARFADVRAQAGGRDLEFLMNIFVVGDEVPPQARRYIGTDAATLIAHDSLAILSGSPQEMADELQRRREQIGLSYIGVNAAFLDALAPVVELLHGR